MAILLLIQTSAIRYRLDMLQTRKPFYFSFRFNYQLQVQIHSRQGSHSVTYPDPSYSTDTFQTRKSFCYSYRSQLQIQSRYAPDTVAILSLIQTFPQPRDAPDTDAILSLTQIPDSNTEFGYSSEMLHTRMLFFCLFRFKAQIQLRNAPDTDVILLLI